jgi:hypothetical protein
MCIQIKFSGVLKIIQNFLIVYVVIVGIVIVDTMENKDPNQAILLPILLLLGGLRWTLPIASFVV